MKYTMVKQFSNSAIDNIYSFFLKWADFAKIFVEFIYSFIEIWIAFFLIFYNTFMYIYYLFLFFIDRSSESSGSMFRIRGAYTKASYVPKFGITSGPNPVSGMYGGAAKTTTKAAETVISTTVETAAQTLTSLKSSVSGSVAKKSILKSILNFFIDFFSSIAKLLIMPFKKTIDFIGNRLEPSREEAAESSGSKSLIDEYMREYEKKKK